MKATLKDKVIWESRFCVLCVPAEPHIPREEGGHLWIRLRDRAPDNRTELRPAEATDVMRLSMLAGEAMRRGLEKRGIRVARINYQENGNWAFKRGKDPVFHLHLYGRTKDAVFQPWGEALRFPWKAPGWYTDFAPFDEGDIAAIRAEMERLETTERYRPEAWGLPAEKE